MIAALLAGIGPKIAMIVAGICALGGLYLGVRHSGVVSQQAADQKRTLKDVEGANAEQGITAGKSDAAVADDLRTKWTR